MAANLAAALLLFSGYASALSIKPTDQPRKHIHGFCKSINIPVPIKVDSAVYDIPRVDNDIDTIAWTIWADTWSREMGPATVIKNTTTDKTFNIHGQLCVPKVSGKEQILQIATHGVHYDGRYWDPDLHPESQSYVEAALREGYSILTYDRLGVGKSDHPDAYDVVQAPTEVEIIKQLTVMARDGSLYQLAAKAAPPNAAFKDLAAPEKVLHFGHSFGSVLTSAFIAKYGELTDGAVITGFLLNKWLGKGGMASFHAEYANTSPDGFKRPSGYVVCKKSGIQTIFFAGNPDTAFTPEMLDYGNKIKQPVPIGEFASAYKILGLVGENMKAPIQYMLAENDVYICGGDCKGIFNATEEARKYPNAAEIDVQIQPNTGHAFPLHNNCTAGYQLTFDFLQRHGL
jgi:pimeloyl-ACP methyl ester carboxylesterase